MFAQLAQLQAVSEERAGAAGFGAETAAPAARLTHGHRKWPRHDDDAEVVGLRQRYFEEPRPTLHFEREAEDAMAPHARGLHSQAHFQPATGGDLSVLRLE